MGSADERYLFIAPHVICIAGAFSIRPLFSHTFLLFGETEFNATILQMLYSFKTYFFIAACP